VGALINKYKLSELVCFLNTKTLEMISKILRNHVFGLYNIPLYINLNFILKKSITHFPDLLRSVIHPKALAKQLIIVSIFTVSNTL
jgi:hypothetical protein